VTICCVTNLWDIVYCMLCNAHLIFIYKWVMSAKLPNRTNYYRITTVNIRLPENLTRTERLNIRGTKAFTSTTNFRAWITDIFVHSFLHSPVLPPVTANSVNRFSGWEYGSVPVHAKSIRLCPESIQFTKTAIQYVSRLIIIVSVIK
jgi:hypothetical protein